MATQIYQHVKQCCECQFSKHQSVSNTKPLSQRSPVTMPFMEWHIDIGEVVKASDTGYIFFLIAVDRFSQSVELVATVIYSEIYCCYGIRNITTYWSSCFISKLMKHVNALFHIKHKLTCPPNSKSNGVAEKTVKRVKDALRIDCRTGNLDKWVEFLPMIAMSSKAMPSSVTGFSPFELIHGIKMNITLDQSLANISAQLPLDVQHQRTSICPIMA